MRLGAGIWAVTLAGARRRNAPICNRSFTNPSHAHVNPTGGSLGPFMRTLTRQVVAWGSSPTATQSSAWSEPSSPNKTTNGPKADATSASTSSPNHDSHPNPPNRRTPHSNSAHNPTRRTQNDYTTPQDLTLQPMTPLQPLMQASMKPPSPLHAPEQGSLETDITSAPEKRTKNALFSPAKAMTVSVEARPAPAKATTVSVEARPAPAKATAVSTPHRHMHAKATAVSDNRAAWSAEPDHSARGRRRGLAGLRDDAPSEARGADGERAGRRPRAHQAARPHSRGLRRPEHPWGHKQHRNTTHACKNAHPEPGGRI